MGATVGISRPLTVLQAAAFQCANIKAWFIAISGITTYTVVDASLPLGICQIAAWSAGMSVLCWTLFGGWLRQFLSTAQRLRRFNYAMAVLLIGSIMPMLQGRAGGGAVKGLIDKRLCYGFMTMMQRRSAGRPDQNVVF